jgi:hypothetical protein
MRSRVIAIQSGKTRTFGTISNSLIKQFRNLHQSQQSLIYLLLKNNQIWKPLALLLHAALSPKVFSMTLSE